MYSLLSFGGSTLCRKHVCDICYDAGIPTIFCPHSPIIGVYTAVGRSFVKVVFVETRVGPSAWQHCIRDAGAAAIGRDLRMVMGKCGFGDVGA